MCSFIEKIPDLIIGARGDAHYLAPMGACGITGAACFVLTTLIMERIM